MQGHAQRDMCRCEFVLNHTGPWPGCPPKSVTKRRRLNHNSCGWSIEPDDPEYYDYGSYFSLSLYYSEVGNYFGAFASENDPELAARLDIVKEISPLCYDYELYYDLADPGKCYQFFLQFDSHCLNILPSWSVMCFNHYSTSYLRIIWMIKAQVECWISGLVLLLTTLRILAVMLTDVRTPLKILCWKGNRLRADSVTRQAMYVQYGFLTTDSPWFQALQQVCTRSVIGPMLGQIRCRNQWRNCELFRLVFRAVTQNFSLIAQPWCTPYKFSCLCSFMTIQYYTALSFSCNQVCTPYNETEWMFAWPPASKFNFQTLSCL